MPTKEKEAFCIFTLPFKVQALDMNEIFDHLSYGETNCLTEIFMSNHTWLYTFVSWFMSSKYHISTLLGWSQNVFKLPPCSLKLSVIWEEKAALTIQNYG